MKPISNELLKAKDVPKSIRTWEKFALTFDAYEFHGSFEACAAIANVRNPATLTEYRTCLFFEQRRWRHMDCGPGGWSATRADKKYIKTLLDGIRSRARK